MDEFLAVLTSVSRAVKAHLESRLQAYGVHAGQQFILECLWREDHLDTWWLIAGRRLRIKLLLGWFWLMRHDSTSS